VPRAELNVRLKEFGAFDDATGRYGGFSAPAPALSADADPFAGITPSQVAPSSGVDVASTTAAKMGGHSASSALPDLSQFADDAGQALPLADASMAPRDKIRQLARDTRDVINLTKAIPASFDNSALFGQGAIVAGARPSLIPGAAGDAGRSAMSRTRFEAFKRNLVTHPNQQLRESSGLYLASIGEGEDLNSTCKCNF